MGLGDTSPAALQLTMTSCAWVVQEATGFGAVAGLTQQKAALHSAVVLPLRHPQLFSNLGVAPLKVLLHGPPGTGKTSIIPRLAEEARAFLEASAVLCPLLLLQ